MPTHRSGGFFTLGLTNFLAQYHHYLTAFVASTFLASFVGEEALGFVVAGMSLITALTLFSTPSLFTAFGTRNVLGFLGLLELAVLLGLSVAETQLAVIVLFILQGAITYALFIGIDLLVEARTCNESETGNMRGMILTITNFSIVLATYSLSFILVDEQYYRVFIAAALVLLPFIFIAFQVLPAISHVAPPKAALPSAVLSQLRASSTMRAIVGAHFLLQLFFSWMVIYSPILLHDYIHFSWSDISIILAIAMTPYVILEYPLGWIADHLIGEKEILVLGFIILIGATATMAFIDGVSLYAWIIVMVVSRIGAAMVEVMTETHFFKQVSLEDPAAISTFRILRPLGNVIGPIIASLALLVMIPFPYMFAVFACILVLGVPLALSITDSK